MTDFPRHSRRDFIGRSSGWVSAPVLAAAATEAGAVAGSQERARLLVPQSTLGRTGEKVSRLGLGCAHFQRAHISPDDVSKTLHRALELGVTYLDTAPNYGRPETGYAEEKMGPTIREIRDRVYLVTKVEEPDYDGAWKLMRQSMKRLQTDRLDLVHLHNIGEESRFPDLDFLLGSRGALGALKEAQKQGVVRHIGASGHLYPSRFHRLLDSGEIDVLMNAVNFVCQHTYDFEHKVWTRAHQENLGLVAMKVLGGAGQGNKGYRIPAEYYEKAIRYALGLPGLSVCVLGLKNVAELEKAASVVAGATPLDDAERLALATAGLQLSATGRWPSAYGEPLS